MIRSPRVRRARRYFVGVLACIASACSGPAVMYDAMPFEPMDAGRRDVVSAVDASDVVRLDGPTVDVVPLDVEVPADSSSGGDAATSPPADASVSDAETVLDVPAADAGVPIDGGDSAVVTADVVAPRDDAGRADVVVLRDVVGVRDGAFASRCALLAEGYARAVAEAQTCMRAEQCALPVCETLCCSCGVYVNPTAVDSLELASMQAEWVAYGCAAMVECPVARCEAPTRGDCTARGRCVTLRR